MLAHFNKGKGLPSPNKKNISYIRHKATTLKDQREGESPREEPPALPVTEPVVRSLFTPEAPERILEDRQAESHEVTPREVIAPPADPETRLADEDPKDTSLKKNDPMMLYRDEIIQNIYFYENKLSLENHLGQQQEQILFI